MTWNIHGRRGRGCMAHLARVVNIVRAHDPDIVALQEIDARALAKDEPAPLAFLTRWLGTHNAEARTIVAEDGHYGHAVFSRWPLSQIKLHDISHGRWESRCVIEADVATPYGPANLSAVHLGLWFSERRWQARRLAEIARSEHRFSVMLGDFNEWARRGPVQQALSDVLPANTDHRTFPAFGPVFALDRIYCRPRGALVSSWADSAGRGVSDHLPVLADIVMSR